MNTRVQNETRLRTFLKVAYDGSEFHGFQIQPNILTVEGKIKAAVSEMAVYDPSVKYSGRASRTDRGVSALANVVAIDSDKEISPSLFNGFLSEPAIRAWASATVSKDLNPRHARSKKYAYFWPRRSAMTDRSLHELSALQQRAKVFVGQHDFQWFSKTDERCSKRSVDCVSVSETPVHWILSVQASSFIWQQVRRMANALFNRSDLSTEHIALLLESPEKCSDPKIQAAHAQGLLLEQIFYDTDDVKWTIDTRAAKGMRLQLVDEILRLERTSGVFDKMAEMLRQRP